MEKSRVEVEERNWEERREGMLKNEKLKNKRERREVGKFPNIEETEAGA